MKRKSFTFTAVCVAAGLAIGGTAHSQSAADKATAWPQQPIRLIVPFGPGGGSDLVGRVLGQHLGEKLGTSIVVENRPGAGGSIGATQVARSAPDGYTLLLGSSSEVVQYPAVNPKVPYQVEQDFAPVSQVATVPLVLVASRETGAKSVAEFIDYARQNTNVANYGSAGIGSSTHLAMALLLLKSGVTMNHVPYKGSAAVVTDLLGGSLHAAMPTLSSVLSHKNDDRLVFLAASTAQSHTLWPELPGMAKAGVPDYDISLWTGVLAPSGTPAPVIQKLNAAINEVLALPQVKDALAKQGAVVAGGNVEDFQKKITQEAALWKQVVAETNITLE